MFSEYKGVPILAISQKMQRIKKNEVYTTITKEIKNWILSRKKIGI